MQDDERLAVRSRTVYRSTNEDLVVLHSKRELVA